MKNITILNGFLGNNTGQTVHRRKSVTYPKISIFMMLLLLQSCNATSTGNFKPNLAALCMNQLYYTLSWQSTFQMFLLQYKIFIITDHFNTNLYVNKNKCGTFLHFTFTVVAILGHGETPAMKKPSFG